MDKDLVERLRKKYALFDDLNGEEISYNHPLWNDVAEALTSLQEESQRIKEWPDRIQKTEALLAEVQAERDKALDHCLSLQVRLEQAEKDAKRFDWLAKRWSAIDFAFGDADVDKRAVIIFDIPPESKWTFSFDPQKLPERLRQSVDAAEKQLNVHKAVPSDSRCESPPAKREKMEAATFRYLLDCDVIRLMGKEGEIWRWIQHGLRSQVDIPFFEPETGTSPETGVRSNGQEGVQEPTQREGEK